MSISEQSQDPNVPAVQGLADVTNQQTSGVGVYGGVGLPDTGLAGAPPLNLVGVYGTTVALVPAGIGVYGASSSGMGVYGISANSIGVKGESKQFDAVQGVSHSAQHAGVSGQNDGGGFGVWANSSSGVGVYGYSGAAVGIQGESKSADAVNGLSHSNQHAGVAGHNDAGGPGVWAVGSPAGSFIGDVNVTGSLSVGKGMSVGADMQVKGTITVGTDIVFSNAADVAEDFDLSCPVAAAPGTVMVLAGGGGLEPCHRAYDRKVAGVVSGAGTYKAGLILDRRPASGERERATLALVGKVFCKVDASYGSIAPGDLLTTSPTPGHAMRADDPTRAFGCVIGKALGTCTSGHGLVPILIALQ